MASWVKNGWHLPSPIQRISHPIPDGHNIHLQVKREDIIHPKISGNKWRKLKYLLEDIRGKGSKSAITFGGAYSNHLYSFAAASKYFDIKAAAIVRGEEHQPLNPTLKYVNECNVDIHYVDRESYRLKEKSSKVKKIIDSYTDPYLIPEGGSTVFAYQGLQEMMTEIDQKSIKVDIIAIAAGTGCTSGCLINTLKGGNTDVEVYSALKGDFMVNEVMAWAQREDGFKVIMDTHLGGYGKVNASLIEFINDFYGLTGIPLDPIYNGKLVYGLFKRIEEGIYPRNTKILWIHTGGIQGIAGFNDRWKGKYLIDQ